MFPRWGKMRPEGQTTLFDIDLTQRCLEGDEGAFREFQETHSSYLSKLLYGYGASDADAAEMLADLWTDCLASVSGGDPLLQRYNGSAPLRSWLGAVVVNRWISKKRRDAVHSRAVELIGTPGHAHAAAFETETLVDARLSETIEEAVREAFNACEAEDIVLLHLVHVHDITQREIAELWGCHESGISRRLRKTEKAIEQSTLQKMREFDALLDINWEDFLRLCESTNILRGESPR